MAQWDSRATLNQKALGANPTDVPGLGTKSLKCLNVGLRQPKPPKKIVLSFQNGSVIHWSLFMGYYFQILRSF